MLLYIHTFKAIANSKYIRSCLLMYIKRTVCNICKASCWVEIKHCKDYGHLCCQSDDVWGNDTLCLLWKKYEAYTVLCFFLLRKKNIVYFSSIFFIFNTSHCSAVNRDIP